MAYDSPAATIPVPVIGTLKTARTSTGWAMIISAAIGLLTLLAGLVLRPYRSELVQAIAELFVATAASLIIIGWAIPAFVIPNRHEQLDLSRSCARWPRISRCARKRARSLCCLGRSLRHCDEWKPETPME